MSTKTKTAPSSKPEVVTDEEKTTALAPLSGNSSLVQMSSEDFDRMVQGGDGWSIQHVVSLREGECIAGIYMGPGPTIELTNAEPNVHPTTGEVTPKTMKTWCLSVSPKVTVHLVGAYQVDRELGAMTKGTWVGIKHLGKKSRPGLAKQLNQYLIATKPAPAGAAQ